MGICKRLAYWIMTRDWIIPLPLILKLTHLLVNSSSNYKFWLDEIVLSTKTFLHADEMFTFGYSHTPPYITYRVISKDGYMHDPVPITISEPIMMHDFAITENYAIFMDLPLYFRPKVLHPFYSYNVSWMMIQKSSLPYFYDLVHAK